MKRYKVFVTTLAGNRYSSPFFLSEAETDMEGLAEYSRTHSINGTGLFFQSTNPFCSVFIPTEAVASVEINRYDKEDND